MSTTTTTTKIFVTGATGYIGGGVVNVLIRHPDFSSFEVVTLVRSEDKAKKLRTLGLKPIIGGYGDLELLTKAAAEADIVITMVDSDNLNAAKAVLEGIKQRFEQTGKPPILIHMTGTAFFMEYANGLHGNSERVYSDLESDVIEAIPEQAFHRNVDVPLIQADKEGYAKVYLICPGTVFGIPSGPIAELEGVQHTLSMQLPFFFKVALDRKRPGYIGEGKNVWPAVSIHDVADLFALIFNKARGDQDSLGHGREGLYIAENLSYSVEEFLQLAGQTLLELGLVDSAEPNALTEEELTKYFGPIWPALATNCAAKGDRSRALGWNPAHGKEEFLNSVKEELLEYLKHNKQ
ncbi:NAD(P)-binding protein [Coprinopsis marcescibilis]|uniref:NAD(P)-binding protein n=1 Tax=Coprinopsis marcescibilis TaxID=230819 RepID=A0A5C3L5S0_COPMA|nr:NAD(P)-binding protein [Coprinopsis marcescibilis]